MLIASRIFAGEIGVRLVRRAPCAVGPAMSRSGTLRLHVSVAAFGVLFLCSCRQSWEAPTQTARVVDAETKVGVPDAIVVTSWELFARGGWPAGTLQVQETVTDSDGRFVISDWGPEVRWSRPVRMEPHQPMIRVLADGYCPRLLRNLPSSLALRSAKRTGEVPFEDLPDKIELTPANGDWAKCQQAYIEVVGSAFTLAYWNGECGWTRVPRLVQRLDHDARVGRYDTDVVLGGRLHNLPIAPDCPPIQELAERASR